MSPEDIAIPLYKLIIAELPTWGEILHSANVKITDPVKFNVNLMVCAAIVIFHRKIS